MVTLSPEARGSGRPFAIAVTRGQPTDRSYSTLCVAMRRAPRPTFNDLLPVWWAAALSFIIAAALEAGQARSAEQTTERFAQAAREFSIGRIQDFPVVLSRDPEWRTLSDAYLEMESNLGQRDRLMEEDRLRVQAVLSSMVEGVLAIDADQRIMVVNQSAMEMLSLHGDGVVGRYAGEVVRNPGFEAGLNRARETGQSVQSEFETVGPRRRLLSMRVTPIQTRGATELAVVLYDTTDLRRLETMRKDFVANVSHELKTPLAAIKAYAETLRMGAIDDRDNNRRFLEQIETHAELLERQVRDLMHLARVESGRAAFDIGDVDLDQACHECGARFEDEAHRREVRLRFDPSASPVMVRADREAIQTILDNLVSNAIRYTRPGGFVRISTVREGGFGVLSVVDNGIGIAPEHQSRIFERFYRVDKARSRDVGGTGLGLSIVKHTVQALGGQIELTSSIGRGSTFRILLPLA
jgi:two-component system phosphate regulon sensor histidine kinase PhoR